VKDFYPISLGAYLFSVLWTLAMRCIWHTHFCSLLPIFGGVGIIWVVRPRDHGIDGQAVISSDGYVPFGIAACYIAYLGVLRRKTCTMLTKNVKTYDFPANLDCTTTYYLIC
jgi:hypothetical protein